MILKKSIIAILANFLFLSTPVALAYAQLPATNSALTPRAVIMYPLKGTGSTSAALRPNQTANLQTRAAAEITRRITALNELLTKVNSLKRIPAASKTSYTTQIQNEITNLTALQTKIQADTDQITLKTDVQSIVTSYRVFALFMPQIRLLSAADYLTTVSSNMASLSAKLQTRISQAQTVGQNVTALSASLNDMNAKITDANTQTSAIISEVTPLTPAGYPGNVTTLNDAKAKLMTGITDLKTAATDARQIIQGLVALGATNTNAASGSATNNTTPNTSQ